jgi:hypothetical protein
LDGIAKGNKMPSTSREYKTFNQAMNTILRADPVKVKAAVDAEIQASKNEREARGERKRGRKAKEHPSASPR